MAKVNGGGSHQGVLDQMLADLERSHAEQDKDPEVRKRTVGRSLREQLVEEEYEWRYEEEWWLVDAAATFCDEHYLPDYAAALHYMVEAQKRPYKAGDDGWVWFCDTKIAEGLGDPHSDVDPELYDRMEAADLEEAFQKRYKTHRDAIDALVASFAAATKAGWCPDRKG